MSNTTGLRFIPQQARSIKTRDRIVAEGLTVYRTVGRDRLTTADVATAADVSIGTFYRYFSDRVALLDAIAPDRDAPSLDSWLSDEIIAALEGDSNDSEHDALVSVAQTFGLEYRGPYDNDDDDEDDEDK